MRWLRLLALASVAAGHALAASEAAEHGASHAALVFRGLDADNSGSITPEDVRGAPHALQKHLPGVPVKEFVSFIALADTNADGGLDRSELRAGLMGPSPQLLEQRARTAGDRLAVRACRSRAGRRLVVRKRAVAAVVLQDLAARCARPLAEGYKVPARPWTDRPHGRW